MAEISVTLRDLIVDHPYRISIFTNLAPAKSRHIQEVDGRLLQIQESSCSYGIFTRVPSQDLRHIVYMVTDLANSYFPSLLRKPEARIYIYNLPPGLCSKQD